MLTHIATTESGSLCTRMEKLTAFVELKAAIRRASIEPQLVTKPALATQFAPQASQAEQSATMVL
jgi:hypothetical protein